MVDHIAQTVIHHHACNIDGIGNYYDPSNCLFLDCVIYNSFHHGHGHLYLNNCHNNNYCSCCGRDSSVHGCLGIGLNNYFVVPFSPAENLCMVFYHCIGPCGVYSLCCYLYNSCYGNNCLHLYTVLLAQGEGGGG